MVSRHGLEAIGRLIAAQRPAKRVQVRRVTIDQQLSDSLGVGERTGREYATQVRLDDPVSAQNARTRCMRDRKSTRLNSSHGYISYAVFCLKKKKRQPLRNYIVLHMREHMRRLHT